MSMHMQGYMREASCGVPNCTERWGEQKDRTFIYMVSKQERTYGQTVGAPRQGVLHWAFKGHPKRKEQASQRHRHYPCQCHTGCSAQGDPEAGRLGPIWEDEGAGWPLTLLWAVLQMLQRLCGRVQEEVRALRLCPLEPVQDELLYARDLIKDAKNSRAVSPPQPDPSQTFQRPQESSHANPGGSEP